jgi:hypothetical protein
MIAMLIRVSVSTGVFGDVVAKPTISTGIQMIAATP